MGECNKVLGLFLTFLPHTQGKKRLRLTWGGGGEGKKEVLFCVFFLVGVYGIKMGLSWGLVRVYYNHAGKIEGNIFYKRVIW
jgi:hypothetical protein